LQQLHGYEQQQSGRTKQMGIDISNVVGGRNRSDDYADYAYDTDYFCGRQGRWGAASLEARKSGLLQYIELSTAKLIKSGQKKQELLSTQQRRRRKVWELWPWGQR
jgi:hypothetical protein